MKEQQPKRNKWLTIRMTEKEYKELVAQTHQTTCATLSEYGRKMVLGKPIILRYRNQSIDDFLADMLPLKQELNSLGNNFNLAVRRLHTLNKLSEIQQWILHNEQDKVQLFRHLETISNKINEIYKIWLQE